MKSSEKPWISVLKRCKDIPKKTLKNQLHTLSKAFFLLFVGAYRTLGTTHMGGTCRFTPSCSEYAVQAIRQHSFLKALYLVSKRILKCRPGGTYGYDPVPPCSGECHARI